MKKCKYFYKTIMDDLDAVYPECKIFKATSKLTTTTNSARLVTNQHYGDKNDLHWWTYCPFCGRKIETIQTGEVDA